MFLLLRGERPINLLQTKDHFMVLETGGNQMLKDEKEVLSLLMLNFHALKHIDEKFLVSLGFLQHQVLREGVEKVLAAEVQDKELYQK